MVEDVFEEEEYPEDCFPPNCYKKFPFLAGDDETPFWLGWAQLRLKTFQLIENKYFETAVITMILLSSLALVRKKMLTTLHFTNYITFYRYEIIFSFKALHASKYNINK